MRWLLGIFLLFLPNIVLGDIVITEIFHDPTGSESGNEFVEIFNNSNEVYDLTGLKLKIDDGKKINSLQVSTIDPGEYLILNNDNLDPNLVLYNSSGDHFVELLDKIKYTHNKDDEGKSLQKQLDGTWQVGDPTPGSGPFTLGNNSVVDSSTTQDHSVVTTYKEVTKWNTVEIQPPQDIEVRSIDDMQIILGSNVYIEPEVYDATGKITNVECYITFGDGSDRGSCANKYLYGLTGTYVVNINTKKDTLQANTKFNIDVVEPNFGLFVSRDKHYIEIVNNLNIPVELNGWRIRFGYKDFNIPRHSIISAHGIMKITEGVMGIDIERYGSKAQLINALGKRVIDSSIKPEAENVKESISTSTSTFKEDKVETMFDNTNTGLTNSNVDTNTEIKTTHSTIAREGNIYAIGRHIKSRTVKPDLKTKRVVSVVKKDLVAIPNASTDKSGESVKSVGVLPKGSLRWFLGLLSIIGLASVPMFVRNAV